MKTTIELSDALFHSAKKSAKEQNTTLRSLIEEGLRRVLSTPPQSAPFKLENASVKGEVLITSPTDWHALETEVLSQSFRANSDAK